MGQCSLRAETEPVGTEAFDVGARHRTHPAHIHEFALRALVLLHAAALAKVLTDQLSFPT